MMNDSSASAIVDSPAWRAAVDLPLPSSPFHDEQQERRRHSWARAASRHAKLSAVVAGVAAGENGPAAQHTHRNPQQHPDQGLPFHPLHCAASQGMITAARLLLQRCGGDNNRRADNPHPPLRDLVNTPDAVLGCSPLHWASVTNRVDFVLLLLQHGAEVDARDSSGRTPLYACAAFGAADAAAVLLEHGADEDAEDFRGLTSLHAAAAGNHLEVAGELIAAGADAGRRARVGCTPSHIAEMQGHVEMVELLSTARCEENDIVTEEKMLAAAGGGDPLCWLISQLRASIGLASPVGEHEARHAAPNGCVSLLH